jgi:hypothetical protein
MGLSERRGAPALAITERTAPGEFTIALDERITDPASIRVSFVILLDGDRSE